MPRNDKRPNRTRELFEQLFGSDRIGAFSRLSDGIDAIIVNASALLDDAEVLASAKRYERAEFLLATGQEEMGKAYILVDMCRVDFAQREEVLRRLCKSFYDHVLKHVYFDLSAQDYPGIWELAQLERYFRISAKEWWPSFVEDGEPDMPHDTYFLREANLYVDFDSYFGTWVVPRQPSKAIRFETAFLSPLKDARTALGKLQDTLRAGLFSADVLRALNRGMRQLVITEQTPTQKLNDLCDTVGKDLENALGISVSAFKNSELCRWPMYWIDLKEGH